MTTEHPGVEQVLLTGCTQIHSARDQRRAADAEVCCVSVGDDESQADEEEAAMAVRDWFHDRRAPSSTLQPEYKTPLTKGSSL